MVRFQHTFTHEIFLPKYVLHSNIYLSMSCLISRHLGILMYYVYYDSKNKRRWSSTHLQKSNHWMPIFEISSYIIRRVVMPKSYTCAVVE